MKEFSELSWVEISKLTDIEVENYRKLEAARNGDYEPLEVVPAEVAEPKVDFVIKYRIRVGWNTCELAYSTPEKAIKAYELSEGRVSSVNYSSGYYKPDAGEFQIEPVKVLVNPEESAAKIDAWKNTNSKASAVRARNEKRIERVSEASKAITDAVESAASRLREAERCFSLYDEMLPLTQDIAAAKRIVRARFDASTIQDAIDAIPALTAEGFLTAE